MTVQFTPGHRCWYYATARRDETLRRVMRRFGIRRYFRLNGQLACRVMHHERRWIERATR